MAVADVSPVTIFTSMPAFRQSCTACGTSLRTGSLMATTAWKRPLQAKASVRMACR